MSCASCDSLAAKGKACWRHQPEPETKVEHNRQVWHLLRTLSNNLAARPSSTELSITFVDAVGETPQLSCTGLKMKELCAAIDAWVLMGTPMWVNVYRASATGLRYEDRISYYDLAVAP